MASKATPDPGLEFAHGSVSFADLALELVERSSSRFEAGVREFGDYGDVDCH
jgi:hypothetical protein